MVTFEEREREPSAVTKRRDLRLRGRGGGGARPAAALGGEGVSGQGAQSSPLMLKVRCSEGNSGGRKKRSKKRLPDGARVKSELLE